MIADLMMMVQRSSCSLAIERRGTLRRFCSMPDISELPPIYAAAHRRDFEGLKRLIKSNSSLIHASLDQDYDKEHPATIALLDEDESKRFVVYDVGTTPLSIAAKKRFRRNGRVVA